MARQIEVGDTFQDARKGQSGTVRIVSIKPTGPCFQIRWSHMDEFKLCPYVTEERLMEITAGKEPISRVDQEVPSDIDLLEPETLTPADYVSAHVYPSSDGSVVVQYFAFSQALDDSYGSDCRALRNEVTGKYLFDNKETADAVLVAKMIANATYPYRLSPDTDVYAMTFPDKRALLERLRLKIFGGRNYIESDDFTKAVKIELSRIAQASPPSDKPILITWN